MPLTEDPNKALNVMSHDARQAFPLLVQLFGQSKDTEIVPTELILFVTVVVVRALNVTPVFTRQLQTVPVSQVPVHERG